jgi:hypothetical protein
MPNDSSLTIRCFSNGRAISTITFEQVCMGAQIVQKLIVNGEAVYDSTGGTDSYVDEITSDFVRNAYADHLESLAEEYRTIESEVI